MTDPVEVYERWQMKNGEFAVIQFRSGHDAVGHVEGIGISERWSDGKSPSGSGYDLVKWIPVAGTPLKGGAK